MLGDQVVSAEVKGYQRPLRVRDWVEDATGRLRAAGVPSPEVDARALVMYALNLSPTTLITCGGEVVAAQDAGRLAALLEQRCARVPLQYLLGETEWGGVRLRVDRRALIPRPETEWLLHLALDALTGVVAPRVLDVGTGTGALALGVKHARPDASVTATDLSLPALELAQENARLNGLEVALVETDLLTGLSGPVDLILSNPPYLPAADREDAQPEVAHDPPEALYAGPDGLEVARRLADHAPALLGGGGLVLLELDPRNVGTLADEWRAAGWRTRVHPDLTGRERFLEARPGVPA